MTITPNFQVLVDDQEVPHTVREVDGAYEISVEDSLLVDGATLTVNFPPRPLRTHTHTHTPPEDH